MLLPIRKPAKPVKFQSLSRWNAIAKTDGLMILTLRFAREYLLRLTYYRDRNISPAGRIQAEYELLCVHKNNAPCCDVVCHATTTDEMDLISARRWACEDLNAYLQQTQSAAITISSALTCGHGWADAISGSQNPEVNV